MSAADHDQPGTEKGTPSGLPQDPGSILEALSHPILVINAQDYRVEYANQAVRESGRKGATCYALLHGRDQPCDGAESPCPLVESRRTRRPVRFEHVHRDRTGGERVFEIHGQPVVNGGGELTHIVLSETDVTARRRAEQALRRSEELYRHLYDQSPVMLCSIDENGRISSLNRRWLEETGYRSGEVIGRKAEFMIRPESARTDFARRLRKLASDDLPHSVPFTFVSREGFPLEVILTCVSTTDPSGRPLTLVAAENVTDRRRTVEARTFAETQSRLATMGRLAAGIAHDLNRILQTIRLSGEQIREAAASSDEVRESADVVVGQVERGAHLIRQIRDYIRQPDENTVESLDLTPFVHGVVKFLKRTLAENLRVVFETDSEEHWILGNGTQIEQVVTNLALNARDAMPEGGELWIDLARIELGETDPPPFPGMWPGPWIRLRVSDTGTGIPPAAQPRVFEPFFTTKPKNQGTGLGLSQVYGIVKQHGGFIDFSSEPGEGTTFLLFFPQQIAFPQPIARPRPEAPPPARELPRGRGQKILVVEDEESLLRVTSRTLKSFGYQVVATPDGTRALEICEREGTELDLVLTDLIMPDLDGRALIRCVRQRNPQVKCILMTGHAEAEDDFAGEELSALLLKPFSIENLVEKVAAALEALPAERSN